MIYNVNQLMIDGMQIGVRVLSFVHSYTCAIPTNSRTKLNKIGE